jgi:hypothetical protein
MRPAFLARIGVAFLFCTTSCAQAFTPESGFYNTFTSDAKGGEGTGIGVEIQNDYMLAAGFAYRPDGTPTFVTIEGQLEHRPNGNWGLSLDDGLYSFHGGQCIGSLEHCPYRPATASRIGGFAIEFTSENAGHLEWGAPQDRASVELRRTCAGSLCYDAPSSLLGEWDIVIDGGSGGLTFGGDKIAIADVTPSGDRRTLAGCIAKSENAAPKCDASAGSQKVEGEAIKRCVGTVCSNRYDYRVWVRTEHCKSRCAVVRLYSFSENGDGGAFGGTVRGTVSLCPEGARSADACATRRAHVFVGYRSGSINFVRTGEGMN